MVLNAFVILLTMALKTTVYITVDGGFFMSRLVGPLTWQMFVGDVFTLAGPSILICTSHTVRQMLKCALKRKKYSL
jgi:hypothetical protein